MGSNFFTKGNDSNLTIAVCGLDVFTKNWCMNVEETEKMNEPIFKCKECEFETSEGICLIKRFASKHRDDHNYPLDKFGSMSR